MSWERQIVGCEHYECVAFVDYFSSNMFSSLNCWLPNRQFYTLLYARYRIFKKPAICAMRLLSLISACLYLPAVYLRLLQKKENERIISLLGHSKGDGSRVKAGVIRWQTEVQFLDYSDVIRLSFWVEFIKRLLTCEISWVDYSAFFQNWSNKIENIRVHCIW